MGEVDHFRDAWRFLTIVRTSDSSQPFDADWLARSLKYFPAVGICIGGVSAAVWLLADRIWGDTMAALLAVAASAIMSGALHEDGLADTADAFGGGWSVEKRLAIMKDSRIGTYGALALGFGVLLRVVALAALPPWAGAVALVACHAVARTTPAAVLSRLSYSGDAAAMKVAYAQSPLRTAEWRLLSIIAAVAVLPLAFVSLKAVVTGLLLGSILAAGLAVWSRKLIGGYTGDVLGAIEQAFEIGFLLGAAAALSS
ncbi:MAG: adenosylcobinamide-GDP ribazoletransferase [Proteobacteria bacterium]|nr:adenosylcobinamide-GDP ribazoletransferase [Pseudomonadota bacterium]